MTRTLIYVIAAFSLWLYFKYGTFGAKAEKKTMAEKYTIKDYDNARSGSGGTATVSTTGRLGGKTVNPLSDYREERV